MYRIICESLKHYAECFGEDINDPRYRPVVFLRLIEDLDEYRRQKADNSESYRQLSHFLWHISGCERCEQILYELNMLGIEAKPYESDMDFSEQHKIWHGLLKLGYWK